MQTIAGIEVVPLSPACGAEIRGVDLAKPLREEAVQAIKNAWGEHLVLVLRGQSITQDQQLRFASYFGDVTSRTEKDLQDYQLRFASYFGDVSSPSEKVVLVSNIEVDGQPMGVFGADEMLFHIDAGYRAQPYKYTFLYALALPSTGGNTKFSNMYKAYEAVPPALKQKLQGSKALHICTPRDEYKRSENKADIAGDISSIAHCYHPVFVTHPDTGRETLFVDRLMTARIDRFDEEESDSILDELCAIGERREFIYEHVWKLGDFVMWDNRCTIHARTEFPKKEPRLLRRCTVEGEPLYGRDAHQIAPEN